MMDKEDPVEVSKVVEEEEPDGVDWMVEEEKPVFDCCDVEDPV